MSLSSQNLSQESDPFAGFHPVTATWFRSVFKAPTAPQRLGWPVIARGENALILAPTGTGKTLTAFLWCLDRLMLKQVQASQQGAPQSGSGCRVLYVSPLKALAVDVERNLRAPLAGIAMLAKSEGVPIREPSINVRTGDTPQAERARFRRNPAEILITTPESLYLLLTSQASETLRTVDTVIIDEIHALVPTKRGAHLALSLERLEALAEHRLQRIGLSATQRPLEEVARFLGGVEVSAAAPMMARRSHIASAGIQPSHQERRSPGFEEQSLAEEPALDPIGPATDEPDRPTPLHYRPVTIVDAATVKQLKLRIEVPVEDMARLQPATVEPLGMPASQVPRRVSIWNAIHPRLLEIIRERRSTILFVNSRQVSERLAGALNDLAGEELVRAHHGSLAASQRSMIEEQLKAGQIKALVATSTLELGIDMGAVDLVVQIESPPSVASGMQRIGRAGHSVDAVSEGILFPKYRADLIACAAVTRSMHEGHIERTRYPRNPLDVLCQQLVAMVAHPPGFRSKRPSRSRYLEDSGDSSNPEILETESELKPEVNVEALYELVRRSAPFADLARSAFDGVLDLLSGRYPSDEFAELRPRLTWDRIRNVVSAREGAGRLAILNAGTIPDRGLYGVFLRNAEGRSVRVGELDEEMVFESHPNETFILGASTWRIEDITYDRVLVVPAPGEPGKMPFWKGDGPGRQLEFGKRIGALVRELRAMPKAAALTRLVQQHDLEPGAAENLLEFLSDQERVTGMVPDDRTVVIERTRDELGDWRVCILSPFGTRIHIPWAMAVSARIRAGGGPEVETLWGDDGFVLRFPDTDQPPDANWILLESAQAMPLVLSELGSTALFAGRFREAAGRALLLPRRRADQRSPLWQLRKRSNDLLGVASRYPSFPLLLESYRECLRDVFDMSGLIETLREIEQGQLRVHVVETHKPSPFAASLLFSYVANFVYDGDAPLAERRAQALTIDQEQLRELLGEADLRELLDPDSVAEVEQIAQCLVEPHRVSSADGIHDLLLRLGDLSRVELANRVSNINLLGALDRLLNVGRLLELKIGGEQRLIAAEDAARYRDALGLTLPAGLPSALLKPVAQPVLELVRRYGRTHGPFTPREIRDRFQLDLGIIEMTLRQLTIEGPLLEGTFRPGGQHREWCDADVLRQIRRKSLARLRREVEPVEHPTLGRLFSHWQGLLTPRRNSHVHLDGLLDAIESLQGAPVPASLLETLILPARIAGYEPAGLDTLVAAGEVVWSGIDPIGDRDGRIALFLADKVPLLQRRPRSEPFSEREEKIVALLESTGASFFDPLHLAVGGGYPGETIDALWNLVWRGLVTNDSLHALRAYISRQDPTRPQRKTHTGIVFRSRRTTPPNAQGRWSLLPSAPGSRAVPTATEASHALALQLLNRYGVLTREAVAAENIPGGFGAVYDVLKALEESGRIRRGYFVAGLGATQFALPAALELLRQLRNEPPAEKPEFVQLAAADPANPYGAVLPWPDLPVIEGGADAAPRVLTRASYAEVILRNGRLVGWLRRNNPHPLIFLPADEPDRSRAAAGLAHFLAARGQQRLQKGSHQGVLITTINGQPAAGHPMARFLMDAGFHPGPLGLHLRRIPVPMHPPGQSQDSASEEWQ